jgi:dienelactone hydrolase
LKALLSLLLIIFSAITFGSEGTNNGNKEFTASSQMQIGDWTDQRELDRVWQTSIVMIPLAANRVLESSINSLDSGSFQNNRYPTVILLHGCSGVWKGIYRRMEIFANNGFAVITPVSFARKKYPKSCDVVSKTAGLYRGIVSLRKNDTRYAIRKARELPWVDGENIFLVGHSEGAIIAATFNDPESPVNARVVESWTCDPSWREYGGINAPITEPVLTLLAEHDPWFNNPWNTGSCDRYIDTTNGSKSIVFTQAGIRDRHALLELEKVQKIVVDFLTHHRK